MTQMPKASIPKVAARITGGSENRVPPIVRMRRFFIMAAVLAFPLFCHAIPDGSRQTDTKHPTPELTDEEREIIRDREVLENLPLLQNLDTIELFDILFDMDPDMPESESSGGSGEKGKGGNKP